MVWFISDFENEYKRSFCFACILSLPSPTSHFYFPISYLLAFVGKLFKFRLHCAQKGSGSASAQNVFGINKILQAKPNQNRSKG